MAGTTLDITIAMRRHRNCKIVATLGPASSHPDLIRKLFEAGADVFRLNLSHGSAEDHTARVRTIREIENEYKRPISVLFDLQGPKLRLGVFQSGKIEIVTGQHYRFDLSNDPGDHDRAPLPHPEIFAVLDIGLFLLIDDGKIRVRVERCGADFAEVLVEAGGILSDRKGVNVPGVTLPISALSAKDLHDLDLALDLGADWVNLSFLQRPEDILETRNIVGDRAKIGAKIEKPAAIQNLDEIIELSDAVMVARGDLGVEMPPEEVPILQKRIVQKCRHAGKPVIVATQMLESMIHLPLPTRAEASDVANAVYEGADAVMLSAETASGDHPVEAVAMMDRIIRRVEADPYYRKVTNAEHPLPLSTSADAVSNAIRSITHVLSATATVTYTSSGSTSLRVARERPESPILSLTPNLATARRLALVWGVHSVQTGDVANVEDMVDKACHIALREGFTLPGHPIIIVAGMPFGTPGSTNLMRIAWTEGAPPSVPVKTA